MAGASHGQSGLGTTFKFNNVAISDLKKVGGVEVSADTIETTTLDSTFKEYIVGIPDAGEVEIEGNFYPQDTTGQVALFNAVGSRTATACEIILPAALKTKWSFDAFVTKFKAGEAEPEGVIPFSATIKISGQPTLTVTP